MSQDQESGSYILAIDQGTTGTTTIVFDRFTNVVGRAYAPVRQVYPRPGWVEHDPVNIWDGVVASMRDALDRGDVRWDQIQAIGITNQRETTVLWDRKTGLPVHHAIVWQDRRTLDMCDKLRNEGIEGEIRSKTGL